MTTIKNELIGTWTLLSYIEIPTNGADSTFPMGKSPVGTIMYGADGYMSVQISNPARQKFNSNDRYVADAAEMEACVKGFIAFSGSYHIDNKQAVVKYHINNSSYPNWEGEIQERKVDFEGDILYLKSVEPILSGGFYVHSYMTWRRIEKQELISRRDRFLEINANKQKYTSLEDLD
ncbi:hypothetical protein GQF61_01275 [Sphingobacterium sp. DK4209]|uniref:Lipocalin-like domain-containing protein n=1 Tax=Sphingobacterium zhuxiongii TaxID=2662364 RepID=A0A5Q0Q6V8_9SPHI|nr:MULTISPECIES: lipocalin-like domain-containing protein [unclassified Sphingobacterium]MVZ64468.1 hypothetical protein [Sphingobacterium sp. DK4209]QGA25805.1 hypothetical protein GFH32_05485 [Sphingobacterium sp. dk4302]